MIEPSQTYVQQVVTGGEITSDNDALEFGFIIFLVGIAMIVMVLKYKFSKVGRKRIW